MLAQIERLQRLVAQLLDLSRLESGGSPLHKVRFDVAELLDAVADEASLHSPDLDVSVATSPEGLQVIGDPERLHQVLANLADNAARFAPDQSTVELSAAQHGDRVVLEVVDHGPGIPADSLGRVFDRFYRTDEARSTDEGGSGLGLAIARWIVELHGGTIRAEQVQQAEPHGCRMVVELPTG